MTTATSSAPSRPTIPAALTCALLVLLTAASGYGLYTFGVAMTEPTRQQAAAVDKDTRAQRVAEEDARAEQAAAESGIEDLETQVTSLEAELEVAKEVIR